MLAFSINYVKLSRYAPETAGFIEVRFYDEISHLGRK
jgi:hypothetical protein